MTPSPRRLNGWHGLRKSARVRCRGRGAAGCGA
jgi:hypothetical protein